MKKLVSLRIPVEASTDEAALDQFAKEVAVLTFSEIKTMAEVEYTVSA